MLRRMRLYFTESSPFVRKVLVAAHELGVQGRIETTFLRPSPRKADPELSKANPLSKIPALVTDDGTTLFDSRVIVEYLHTLAPADAHALVPSSGPSRFRVLRTQALCDGILEAGIAVRYEQVERPEAMWFEPWLTGQTEKANQGFDALEREAASFGSDVDLAQICAAITFGWFEFRNPIGDIRKGRPALTKFYEAFLARPSMQATMPKA